MPKIDLASLPVHEGSIYPPPFDQEVAGRSSLRAGDAGGITQFGANIVTLAPGAKSSMRHWHVNEDEFAVVLTGELMLVEDEGETRMLPGDCAAFPANSGNGHCFINRTDTHASFFVVGNRGGDETAHYPDHGLRVDVRDGVATYVRADGGPL